MAEASTKSDPWANIDVSALQEVPAQDAKLSTLQGLVTKGKNHAVKAAKDLEDHPSQQAINILSDRAREVEWRFQKYEAMATRFIEMASDKNDQARVQKLGGLIDQRADDRDEATLAVAATISGITTALKRDSTANTTGTLDSSVFAAPKAKPNTALKPQTLKLDHSWLHWVDWRGKVAAYFKASNFALEDLPIQQQYFYAILDGDLAQRIKPKVNDTTEVLGGTGTMESLLHHIFEQKYPLFNRRLDYFRLTQKPSQLWSAFDAALEARAAQADIPGLDADELAVFRYFTGTTDKDLMDRFQKLVRPNKADMRREADAYEAAASSRQALDTTSSPAAAASINKTTTGGGDKANSSGGGGGQGGGMGKNKNRRPWERLPDGGCGRCGQKSCPSDRQSPEKCNAWGKTCDKCGGANHFSPVCLKKGKGVAGQPKAQPKRRPAHRANAVDASKEDDDCSPLSEDDSSEDGDHVPTKVCIITVPTITASASTKAAWAAAAPPRKKLLVKDRRNPAAEFNFRALPDSGASKSVISHDLAMKHGLAIKGTLLTLTSASGDMTVNGTVRLLVSTKTQKDIVMDALVSSSLRNEMLLSWGDMTQLHILSRNFPDDLPAELC
jgi:hypothetical protein